MHSSNSSLGTIVTILVALDASTDISVILLMQVLILVL